MRDDLPLRHRDHFVRHALGTMWRTLCLHVRPYQGLPRMTAGQVDMLITELRERYIPALEAIRDRGDRVPQRRERQQGFAVFERTDTPMSDALDVLGLIAESKESRERDERP